MLKLAVFTGASPRHKRFVLELEAHFQDKIEILWVATKGNKKNRLLPTKLEDKREALNNHSNASIIIELTSKLKTIGLKKAYKTFFNRVIEKAFKKSLFVFHALLIKKAERFYYPNIGKQKSKQVITSNPNSNDIETLLKEFTPDLFVSFGGPIYKKHIYGVAKIAINQHAGISPCYKGSYTTEQAILRADFKHVGVTVHHISDLVDEGAIINTERLQLSEFDSPARIFVRNCALGNDLLIRTIEKYINKMTISGQVQSNEGTTYFAKDMGAAQLASLYFSYFIGNQQSQIKRANNEN